MRGINHFDYAKWRLLVVGLVSVSIEIGEEMACCSLSSLSNATHQPQNGPRLRGPFCSAGCVCSQFCIIFEWVRRDVLRLLAPPSTGPAVPALFVPAFAGLGRSWMGQRWSLPCVVLTRRKPRLLFSLPGELLLRFATRQLLALLFQLPPRFTRFEPDAGPLPFLHAPCSFSIVTPPVLRARCP